MGSGCWGRTGFQPTPNTQHPTPYHPSPITFVCVSRHAGLSLALSTFDGVEHARRLLLVGRDGGGVLLLDGREHRVGVARVGPVPVEALEVALEPAILEDLAVARVNLVAELARVFEEH